MDETLVKIERLKHIQMMLEGVLTKAICGELEIVTMVNYDYEALKWAIGELEDQYVARYSK